MHLVNAHGKLIIKSRQNHEEKYTKCVHFVFVSVVHFHLQKSKLVGGHLIIIWRQNRFETISFPRPPLLPFFLQFLFLLPINRLKIKYRNLKKKKKKKKKMRKKGRGEKRLIVWKPIRRPYYNNKYNKWPPTNLDFRKWKWTAFMT